MPGSAARSTLKVPLPTSADDVVNKDYVDSRIIVIVKKADQAKTNDDTLAADNELKTNLKANKNYAGTLTMWSNAGATPNISYDFSLPAGGVGSRQDGALTASAASNISAFGTPQTIGGTGAAKVTNIPIRIIMGGTAGEFAFIWAQATSDAGASTVLEGSSLILWEELP